MDLPEAIQDLLAALEVAGGRPYIVGGAVRDFVLGLPATDYDIEVFGLAEEALRAALERIASVDAVGQAFTVYKVSGLPGLPGSVDVSLPRKDSKVGPGHRGIRVEGAPDLSIAEASRRRDFTMNALLYDPREGALQDPQGGIRDIEARILRAVDPSTFGDDPLRALRAVVFAARFDLEVEAETAKLCASMRITELPPERILGEVEKLLLKARHPSRGLGLLASWHLLESVAPELIPLKDTPQDPEWHPEGDVFTHTLLAIDEAAKLLSGLDRSRALTVMVATLCHDLGKPATTRFEDGRVRSRGHEEAGVAPTLALLDRLGLHTLSGYDLRAQVVALVGNHLKPGQLYDDRDRVSDGAIRRLAAKCEPELLYRVAKADCLGRAGHFEPLAMDWFLQKVTSLQVASGPPAPWIRGRDLLALGLSPGPKVGRILQEIYEKQLDGVFAEREEALAEASRLVTGESS